MKGVFETAECEAVRNSIFWELRYEKHENQMKGCGMELSSMMQLLELLFVCSIANDLQCFFVNVL